MFVFYIIADPFRFSFKIIHVFLFPKLKNEVLVQFHSSQLVEGTDVLKKLGEVPTYNERPQQDCRVADCGVFEP